MRAVNLFYYAALMLLFFRPAFSANIVKNGVVYIPVPAPSGITDDMKRDFAAALKHFGSNCLRNGYVPGFGGYNVVRGGQNNGVWDGWACPSANPTGEADTSSNSDSGTQSGSGSSGVSGSSGAETSGSGAAGTGQSGADSGSQNSGGLPELPTAPTLPMPAVPKELPPELVARFGKAIEEVRAVYQSILNNLEKDAKNAEINYANSVIYCEKIYAGSGENLGRLRKGCRDNALKVFEDKIAEIRTAMQGGVVAYKEAVSNIKEAIAKEAGIKAEELPAAPDLSKPIDSLCKVDGVWQVCRGTAPAASADSGSASAAGGGSTTVNNTNINSSTTETTTVNNGGSISSTTINNGGESGQSKDYSGLPCMKVGEVQAGEEPDWESSVSLMKQNGESGGGIDYVLMHYLNGGSRMQCPAPLSGRVGAWSYTFSFEFLCRFLHSIRGLVILISSLITGFFVLRSVK